MARKVARHTKNAKRQLRDSKPASGSYRAKIRMYRQGLGDCFLIELPRTDRAHRPFYVMIDCGVILGTADPGRKMTEVVENIAELTGGQIDLLVITHEHWDHLSGFIQAQSSFNELAVREVWLGWTENNKDVLAKKLKDQRDAALASLRLGLSRLQLAGDAHENDTTELQGILEFFGAAKGASTGDALAYIKKKWPNLRYCLPHDDPVEPAGVAATFYVLGPPRDEKLLSKINPSKRDKETYGLAQELFMLGAGSALDIKDGSRPFDRQYEIPFHYAADMAFFQQQYWTSDNAADTWRRIDIDWLGGSTELALQLDSLTNNTSLALAIELPDQDVLLFVADAQVGNWMSWQDLGWDVGGKKVTGPDLVKRAIFYKVGHHGSHNATLKDKGLSLMENLRVAMISVDEQMARKKRWNHMPLNELVEALEEKAKGVVLRGDRPMPPSQERVVENSLFFEVTF